MKDCQLINPLTQFRNAQVTTPYPAARNNRVPWPQLLGLCEVMSSFDYNPVIVLSLIIGLVPFPVTKGFYFSAQSVVLVVGGIIMRWIVLDFSTGVF